MATLLVFVIATHRSELLSWFWANYAQAGAIATIVAAIAVIGSSISASVQFTHSVRNATRERTLNKMFDEHQNGDVVRHRRLYLEVRNDPDDQLRFYAEPTYERYMAQKGALGRHTISEPCGAVSGELPADHRTSQSHDSADKEARERTSRERFHDRRVAIHSVLNRYEVFAIGIRNGALDEQIYREWWKSTLVKDWYEFHGLIAEIRSFGGRNIYAQFEWLALKWEQGRLEEIDHAGA